MYHIFVFSPLVEMLRKKYLALITLICFPVSYYKYIQFSKLFFTQPLGGWGGQSLKYTIISFNISNRHMVDFKSGYFNLCFMQSIEGLVWLTTWNKVFKL